MLEQVQTFLGGRHDADRHGSKSPCIGRRVFAARAAGKRTVRHVGNTVGASRPADQAVPRRLHRPPTRLRVYPNYEPEDVYPYYYPGPNAVRVCNATYVQEYRPSGTVIVPRVSCYWRRGY